MLVFSESGFLHPRIFDCKEVEAWQHRRQRRRNRRRTCIILIGLATTLQYYSALSLHASFLTTHHEQSKISSYSGRTLITILFTIPSTGAQNSSALELSFIFGFFSFTLFLYHISLGILLPSFLSCAISSSTRSDPFLPFCFYIGVTRCGYFEFSSPGPYPLLLGITRYHRDFSFGSGLGLIWIRLVWKHGYWGLSTSSLVRINVWVI